VLSFHPLLVGGNPFTTTSIYTLIAFLERKWGVHFPMGGTGALATGLVGLIENDLGGSLRFNTEVTGIVLDGRRARGVRLANGETIAADIVVGGGATPPGSLVAGVERGLYVATFNYCRILDPKSQVVTGLTRNGTFRIEHGEITGAVSNLRFTQSFVAALGPGRVLGVGDDVRFADSEFGPGLVRAPSLRLAGWNFTGGAAG